MRVVIFIPRDGSEYNYNRSHCLAWNRGMQKHGIIPQVVKLKDYSDEDASLPDADVYVVRGWKKGHHLECRTRTRLIEHQEKHNRQCLIIDQGYVKDRIVYRSVGWDGLNGRADFCNSDSPSTRWQEWGMGLKPWQDIREDNVILLIGQKPRDAAVLYAKNGINEWYEQSVSKIQNLTNRKIVFRPNPRVKVNPELGVEVSTNTLEEDLNRSHVVVTFNSNAGTDAVIAGIPVINTDEGSMVWDISSREIDQSSLDIPLRLNRKQWAWNLAYTQWTREEVTEGLTWDHLKEGCNSYVCSGA